MAYAIRRTDGTLLINLEVGVQNISRTSLVLVGQNSTDYGRVQNENFVKLLENFRSITEPPNSLEGQLWYDLASEQLKVNTAIGYVPLGPFDNTLETAVISDNSNNAATTAFIHSLFPKGVILLWYGTAGNIPNGWALCDGQTYSGVVTPDLRNRFVIGSGGDYAAHSKGGSSSITDLPAHSHNFKVTSSGETNAHSHTGVTSGSGNHNHVFPGDDQLSFGKSSIWEATDQGGFNYDARSVYGGNGRYWETTPNGNHSHTFTTAPASADHNHEVSGTTNSVGVAEVDVLNPYYALCYIMKIV